MSLLGIKKIASNFDFYNLKEKIEYNNNKPKIHFSMNFIIKQNSLNLNILKYENNIYRGNEIKRFLNMQPKGILKITQVFIKSYQFEDI